MPRRRAPRIVDLRQVAPDSDGVVTCPGHGLQFKADTGEPVWISRCTAGGPPDAQA